MTNAMIQFARARGLDPAFLWEGLGVDEETLTDVNAWVSSDVFNAVMARLREHTGDPQIMRHVGRSVTELKTFGFLHAIPLLLDNPMNFVNQLMDGTMEAITKTSDIDILEITPHGVILTHAVKPGYPAPKDTCWFVQGCFEGLPREWGLGLAHLVEEACQAEGASRCRFRITWPRLRWWHRVGMRVMRRRMQRELIQALHQQNTFIEAKYAEAVQKSEELAQAYLRIMECLMEALDAKDPYTRHHSRTVAAYAVEIAKADGLPAVEIEELRKAALLHDIGKIGIPDSVLLKAGPLTPDEWRSVQRHPVLGEKILQPLTFLGPIIQLVAQEHERYDGKGYPRGLGGDQILRGAQMISVADALDAMTSGRAYRSTLSFRDAAAEIERCAGTQFDPTVVQTFTRALPSLEALHQHHLHVAR